MAVQQFDSCNDLIKMEMEFFQFYYHLTMDDLQMIDFESNLFFLRRVRDAYSKHSLQNKLSTITFGSAGTRSAYLFSYGPIFTGIVVYHFINFIYSNPWLLKNAIAENSITITCLGGGSGTEIIAIAKALELSLKLFCLNTKPVTIYANIVDIDLGWKDTVKSITQQWWKFFDRNCIKLRLSFVQFDLSQSFNDHVQGIVKKSCLITMVNFVSAVFGTKCREKIPNMLQEILSHMDKGDLRVCYDLYARHFGREPPTVQCKNHVVAWRKIKMVTE